MKKNNGKNTKLNEILFITQRERATKKNMNEKTLLNALHFLAFSSERHGMAPAALRG